MFDLPDFKTTKERGQKRGKSLKKYAFRFTKWLNRFFAAQSIVPTGPTLDPQLFPSLGALSTHWEDVRDELSELLRDRHALPRFQDISPDQYRVSPDHLWRVFVLYGFGYRSDTNCKACPRTTELLERIPGLKNAFFSILAPGKQVPSHRGITKAMVRVHLGLIVPKAKDDCSMTVGGERCVWSQGELLVFDDTYQHEVSNNTDEERAILLLDFWRPMRWPARIVSRTLFSLFRMSSYVQNARRNQLVWEQRYWSQRSGAGTPAQAERRAS